LGGVIFPERIPELLSARGADPPPYFIISSFSYQRYFERPDAVPPWTRFYRRIMQEYILVKEFRPRWLTYGFHSPVIRIYQPAAWRGRLPIDGRAIAGRES